MAHTLRSQLRAGSPCSVHVSPSFLLRGLQSLHLPSLQGSAKRWAEHLLPLRCDVVKQRAQAALALRDWLAGGLQPSAVLRTFWKAQETSWVREAVNLPPEPSCAVLLLGRMERESFLSHS